ncbi:MAG: hypothetical protein ACR2JM_13430 [Mycobacterium sp.]
MSTDEPVKDEAAEAEAIITEADSDTEIEVDIVSTVEVAPVRAKPDRTRLLAFTVLPALALLLGLVAAFLRWQDVSRQQSLIAADESVAAAGGASVAILSYKPETVDKELAAARDRLTGAFLDAYTQLVNDVVIPGAKEKKITAVATVAGAGSVSASPKHAVALVFIDQTTTMGKGAPTQTTSSVRVTLDKVGNRWLVSGFDPV